MTSEQFCYWLQGFAELSETPPSEAQWKLIQEHVKLVFNKKTSTISELERYLKDEAAKPKLAFHAPPADPNWVLPRITC